MGNNDTDNKLQEYLDRHSKWRDISVSQLSFINNLFLTASGTILTLVVKKDILKSLHICTSQNVDWRIFFYVLSLLLIAISTSYGVGVTLCRLYDFRISRHLALVRLRAYKKSIKSLPTTQTIDIHTLSRVSAFYQILFKSLPFLEKSEVEQVNDKSKEKYLALVGLSKNLGNAVWLWTKFQLLFLFVGTIFYMIYLMKS